ncbi:MAG: DeoR/GlpR family DNA-binding transcription regulator, partial [Clostridia bacterium]
MTTRQSQILHIIANEHRVEVVKLAELANVSQVTIRKDLAVLESKGLIKRQHGFAVLNAESDINNRLSVHYERKVGIAARAVELINDGDVILVESGSCCTLLAEQIKRKRKNVTIITYSVYIANHICPSDCNQVILLGGSLLMEPMVTVGPLAIEALSNFYVDKFFTGTDGITPDGEFTAKDLIQAEVICKMAKRAKKTIVLTDSSKFFQQGTV